MERELKTIKLNFNGSSGIGHLTLNRPEKLNSLSEQLERDIIDGLRQLEELNNDEDGIALRAVVIEGEGGNFCAGADITEFDDIQNRQSMRPSHYEFLLNFPVPIIAKVRGYCLGGGLETAIACDFRFAEEDSRFGLPEVNLGINPGAGGVQFISRLANPSVAKEIAMTGEQITARRAHELGIVNRVYSDTELDEATTTFVETIASKPPLAVQAIKDSADISIQAGLGNGGKYDQKINKILVQTDDFQQGVRAFNEDEFEPTFKGK